jgi:hypothetical protein
MSVGRPAEDCAEERRVLVLEAPLNKGPRLGKDTGSEVVTHAWWRSPPQPGMFSSSRVSVDRQPTILGRSRAAPGSQFWTDSRKITICPMASALRTLPQVGMPLVGRPSFTAV